MRPDSRVFVSAIRRSPLRLRADLASLAGLLAQLLVGVLDPLVLVRVRDAEPTDLRGHLAHGFLVVAGHAELLRGLRREGDSGRRLDLDRVREAERKLELLALEDGAVARTVDLEVALVSGRHADDHVLKERAREPVQSARRLLVVHTRDDERAVLTRDRHVLM